MHLFRKMTFSICTSTFTPLFLLVLFAVPLVTNLSESGLFGAPQGPGDSFLHRTVNGLILIQSRLAAPTGDVRNVGRKSLWTFPWEQRQSCHAPLLLCGRGTTPSQTPRWAGTAFFASARPGASRC